MLILANRYTTVKSYILFHEFFFSVRATPAVYNPCCLAQCLNVWTVVVDILYIYCIHIERIRTFMNYVCSLRLFDNNLFKVTRADSLCIQIIMTLL